MSKTHVSASSVHKYQKSRSYLIWPFYVLYQLYEQKCHRTHISASSVTKYHKSCSLLIWPFSAYYLCMSKNVTKLISPRVLCTSITNRVLSWLTVLWLVTKKKTQSSYLREFCALIPQIVFLADLTVLRLIKTVWAKMSKNSFLRGVLCTCIKNRVPSWFGCFTAYYYCLSKNITKLISPRDLCTNFTNRVLRWFDRFTAYYYCISRNVKKLISPRVLCTSIKNRVASWFERFTAR